jgi:hypothetical protein
VTVSHVSMWSVTPGGQLQQPMSINTLSAATIGAAVRLRSNVHVRVAKSRHWLQHARKQTCRVESVAECHQDDVATSLSLDDHHCQ